MSDTTTDHQAATDHFGRHRGQASPDEAEKKTQQPQGKHRRATGG